MLTKGDDSTQTKSLQEWQWAMKKYTPKVLKGDSKQPATVTWTAAKAFQKALESTTSATPTAADVKAGMYTFNNETLGGLRPQPDHVHAGPRAPAQQLLVLRPAEDSQAHGAGRHEDHVHAVIGGHPTSDEE